MSAATILQQTFVLSAELSLNPVAPRNRTLNVQAIKRHRAGGKSCFQLDATFKVLPGISILVGHSGAGKTTLLRSIAGLCDPDEGCIAIGEQVLFDSAKRIHLAPAQRKVGVVFQDLALFPHLTVEDNLSYGLRKIEKSERECRVSAVAESFQIAHLRKRSPRQISGGEQQRVALARALVTQPDALLLDEPLSSLDVRTKARIIEDLRKYNEARRIPMLYVTHDQAEAFALGERVLALEQGRIVREGSPLEILSAPQGEAAAKHGEFENVFEATVVAIPEQAAFMTCRLQGTAIELRIPRTRAKLGAEVRVDIRAQEVRLASVEPDLAMPL